ncbi:MAG: peptidoglycan DD-metalloendopeptidase family protein [Fibrobacter sp.]|nr:peptidoglycan DD-metalloendopeptidase family protein [Fibrobacter sp.]
MYLTYEEALKGHRDFEKGLAKGQIDIVNDYYLIFRYRDKSFIPRWIKLIIDNNEDPLLVVWFINAVEQMNDSKNLKYISAFRTSSNAIIRECVANAYGFIANKDSIPVLNKWLSEEKNGYVRKTIEASIKAIKSGRYKNRIPYLPKYYKETPLKLEYIYNRKINDDPLMQYNEIDTTEESIRCNQFIFPHQQYLWKLKNAPKKGYFGSKTGKIYHIGIDSGWLLEGLPIHSICDGIVKQISHNLSWGNLVVVESLIPSGDTICAIYGHLSPYNNLNVGDTVYMGDRIGQIGNSVTHDNGGYWAHIHFGIEKRSFLNAEISGYDIDTAFYENPVTFIRNK